MSDGFNPVSKRLELPVVLGEALFKAAEAAVRAAARKLQRRRRPRGLILAPSGNTPLWNGLGRQVMPLLAKRGSKAQVARVLGLPRQLLQDCLKSRSVCRDAERTLLLFAWLAARQQGREFSG